jgi:glycosyltransferase involved in cell wall biosynthesis
MLVVTDHKIKLGIDAKWFFKGPPSGNMVVKNLVNEMVNNANDKFELYLLITNEFKKQAVDYFPANVKLVFLPVVPNLLSNLLLIPFLARVHKLEVVLFQNFNSWWSGGFRKIVYIHDVLFLDFPQYYSWKERLYFKHMKRLAAKADLIITISNTEKDRLIRNNVAKGKNIDVIYHGVNSNFKILDDYSKAKIESIILKYQLPERYLLYVGRVNIRKNISRLVSALNLLDDKVIKLLIVGGQGNDLATLQNQIAHEGLTNRVVFTGHVPEEDLYLIYANATVFCFPSYAEGFGLPPLEAMQCGVPVIVSSRTSMPEICGDAALYINPDDAADVAQKINLLLNDNELYLSKVTAGINHSKQFSWPVSSSGILKLISDAYNN